MKSSKLSPNKKEIIDKRITNENKHEIKNNADLSHNFVKDVNGVDDKTRVHYYKKMQLNHVKMLALVLMVMIVILH